MRIETDKVLQYHCEQSDRISSDLPPQEGHDDD
jgi:hypothetical protein